MPLYEYACRKCEHTFEALVFDGEAVECPECHGRRLERLLRDLGMPRGGSTPFGFEGGEDPFAGMFGGALRSGDLTLFLPFLGRGPVRLPVRAKDGTTSNADCEYCHKQIEAPAPDLPNR